ncbi:hypothetical protein BD309DRAFT_859713 [Dichomitus squalens]|nr:hypothetical protein BD309DRAFT_859713 [Dichomitus squalens]
MDAIRLVRGLVANGPPYPDDTPRAVTNFLTAMSAAESCSQDDVSIQSSDHSPRYFLEAFEAFPYRPPSQDAPPRTQLTYSLLRMALFAARHAYYLANQEDDAPTIMDDISAGAIFCELEDRVEEVCDRLSEASTLDDLYHEFCRDEDDPTPCPACNVHEDTPSRPVAQASMRPSSLPLGRIPKMEKKTRRARKPEPLGPLPTFRSAGWGRASSSEASPSTTQVPSARRATSASRSPWDDYSTSSSGFSVSRPR